MNFLILNKKLSRYEVKQSLRQLNSEMLHQYALFCNFHIPKNPESACIIVVKFNSIQYLFCDIYDWRHYYNSVKEKNENAVIMACDVTKGFCDPLQICYYYIGDKNVKTFFSDN